MEKEEYLDFEIDAIDSNGINDAEINRTRKQVVKKIPRDTVLEVRFKNHAGDYYTKKGIVPAETRVLLNLEEEKAFVMRCRNDIVSDWRTLVKLM